ncbi:hypothetical protein LARI1_G005588 [Lachnellula arida]|uniref:Uncharacterized protein n=1 Tax=Lachnellula arida TaxID=1316785 RepID=A0A8T9BBW0_9HELO|nr:hypothetical protein LARI1_G005588 [Lachnellula arida]
MKLNNASHSCIFKTQISSPVKIKQFSTDTPNPKSNQHHASLTNSQRLPLLDRMTSNRLPLLDRTRNLPPTDRFIRGYAHGESSERSDPGNDSRMATRQTQYQQLPAQEQQEQEQWAQSRLSHNWKKCQAGFLWVRDVNGYRCTAGSHFVTDELVAEGKGYFFVGGGLAQVSWDGPIDPRTHYPVADSSRYQQPVTNRNRGMFPGMQPETNRRMGLRPPMGQQPAMNRFSGMGLAGRPLRPPMNQRYNRY